MKSTPMSKHDHPDTNPSTRRLLLVLPMALVLLVAPFTACAQPKAETTPPDHAEIAKTATATAKVVSVDAASRVIVLRGEQGDTLRVVAGPEVRNFAQIAAGDTVRMDYQVSLAVALQKPGEESAAMSVEAAVGRARVGETPGAGVGAQVTVTVRIDSVDKERNIVVFTPPNGQKQVTDVVTPEGREFLRGLTVGDLVQITYTEALALRLEKQ